MNTARGRYSEGNRLHSREVTFRLLEEGSLHVEGEGVERTAPFDDVEVSERLGEIPRFLYFPGGAVIETLDNAFIDAILATRKRARLPALLHRLENHSRLAAAATIVVVALAMTFIYIGIPRLTRQIAQKTPLEVEQEAGERSVAGLRSALPASRLPYAQRQRVHTQLARLLPDVPSADRPKVHFISMGGLQPNAFALLGNHIVVSDEFLLLVSHEDELAAVLAHELGHLHYRHGLQSALRSSLALLVVAGVTGDLSTLATFAGSLPSVLIQNGYSREFEREADRYAHDLMMKHGIPLRRFSIILRRLAERQPPLGLNVSYLSTHPSTSERTALFDTGEELPSEMNPPPTKTEAISVPPSPHPAPPSTFVENTSSATPPPVEEPAPSIKKKGTSLPTVVKQTRPNFPVEMRVDQREGTVRISFLVDADGKPYDLRVDTSTNKGFNDSALQAVAEWRFEANEEAALPYLSRIAVPIIFSFEQEAKLIKWGPLVHPPKLKDEGIEGMVVVSFLINQDGIPTSPRVVESTHPGFNQAALDEIRQRRYDPDSVKGNELETMTLSFLLRNPELKSWSPLEYPNSLYASGIKGSVAVEHSIAQDGSTQDLEVTNSDYPELEPLALKAVAGFKFKVDPKIPFVPKIRYVQLVPFVSPAYTEPFRDFKPATPRSQPPPTLPPHVHPPSSLTELKVVVFIETNGTVSSATVLTPTHPELRQAAIDATLTWTYEPAESYGKTVPSTQEATVTFTPRE